MANRKKEETYAKLWELNPIWDVLTAEEKLLVSDEVQVMRYKKNAVIHAEGDAATDVWTLIEGKVRIYKEGVGQRAQIIRLLKPYDFFGFRAAIAGDVYTSNASAIESSVAYKLNAKTFIQLLHQNHEFCFQMMMALAKDLAVAELQTINLTQKHIRGRLAESLLTIKKNYGLDEDGCTLAMYMSREDLANMSNMTTSNAIRTLSAFASEKLVDIDRRKITILKETELANISKMG